MEGIKHDSGKLRMDLVPVRPLMDEAQVWTDGAKEYPERNWERGMKWSRPYAALQRHLTAWWNGETMDPKSGRSHLAHARCELAMLQEYSHTGAGEDDRPRRDRADNPPSPKYKVGDMVYVKAMRSGNGNALLNRYGEVKCVYECSDGQAYEVVGPFTLSGADHGIPIWTQQDDCTCIVKEEWIESLLKWPKGSGVFMYKDWDDIKPGDFVYVHRVEERNGLFLKGRIARVVSKERMKPSPYDFEIEGPYLKRPGDGAIVFDKNNTSPLRSVKREWISKVS